MSDFIQLHNPSSRQAIRPFVGADERFAAGDGYFLIALEISRRQGMIPLYIVSRNFY